jgi:hypothetical protein
LHNNDIVSVGNVAGSLIPEEGETISVKGGRGNMTLHQRKKENGVHYERDNENSEWKESPDLPWKVYEKMKGFLNI